MKKLMFAFLLVMSSHVFSEDRRCGMYVGGSQIIYSSYESWLQGYYKALNPDSGYKDTVKFSSSVYDLCLHLTNSGQDVSILDAAKAVKIMGADK